MDPQRIAYIERAFSDAYKSHASIVVLDNVERLIRWVTKGSRFSTTVLDAILTSLTKPPPRDRKLLVIATTAKPSELNELGLAFDERIEVPNLTEAHEVVLAVTKYGGLSAEMVDKGVAEYTFGNHAYANSRVIDIGIKPLLTVVQKAKLSEGDFPRAFAWWFGRAMGQTEQ